MVMKADRDVVITTIYVVIDTICQKVLSTPPQKQKMTDAEIVTIAVCSALFFNSNQEKALPLAFLTAHPISLPPGSIPKINFWVYSVFSYNN